MLLLRHIKCECQRFTHPEINFGIRINLLRPIVTDLLAKKYLASSGFDPTNLWEQEEEELMIEDRSGYIVAPLQVIMDFLFCFFFYTF